MSRVWRSKLTIAPVGLPSPSYDRTRRSGGRRLGWTARYPARVRSECTRHVLPRSGRSPSCPGGARNRGISMRRFISRRPVNWHLSKVVLKVRHHLSQRARQRAANLQVSCARGVPAADRASPLRVRWLFRHEPGSGLGSSTEAMHSATAHHWFSTCSSHAREPQGLATPGVTTRLSGQ
jgi:hypothetical protein